MTKTAIHIHDVGTELQRFERVLGSGYLKDLASAVAVVDASPRLAVTAARVAAEHLLKSVLRAGSGEVDDTWTLDRLKQEARKRANLPKRVLTQLELIQNLGNEASHANGETIAAWQARQALEALLQVARWADAQLPTRVMVEPESPRIRPDPPRAAAPRARPRGRWWRAFLVVLGASAVAGVCAATAGLVWLASPRTVPTADVRVATQPASAPSPSRPAVTGAPAAVATVEEVVDPAATAVARGIWARPLAPDEVAAPPAEAVLPSCEGGEVVSVAESAFGWARGLVRCGAEKREGWARVETVAAGLLPVEGSDSVEAGRHASLARARGEGYAAEGRWQEAIAAYNDAMKMTPGDATLYALRARARFEDGSVLRAEGDLALALTGDPELPRALYERAVFERNRGAPNWGETLERAFALAPGLRDRGLGDPRLHGAVVPPEARESTVHPDAAARVDTGVFRTYVNPKAAEEHLAGRGSKGDLLARIPRGTPVQRLGGHMRWMRVAVEVDDRVVEGWTPRTHLDED